MASKHQLSLEVLDVKNIGTFKITDTSVYSERLGVGNETLEVTVPGFNDAVMFEVTNAFDLVLTACDLQLQVSDCGEVLSDLPDGVYHIKYSVSPNSKVFVEYESHHHRRSTK
jgi:hypothetical protein